jgi:glycosyltransferase involved in cell wall biosynthesis
MHDAEFVLFAPRSAWAQRLPTASSARLATLTLPSFALREQIELPRLAVGLGLDLLHCPGTTAPVFGRTPLVLTVHDASFMMSSARMPPPTTTRQRLGRLYRRIVVPRAAHRAARVITVSSHAARECAELLGLDPAELSVIPHGAPEATREREPARADLGVADYVLYFGGYASHKNVQGALAAFELLVRDNVALAGLEMLLLGVPPERAQGLLGRVPWLAQSGRVRALGFVSDAEEKRALVEGARCLLVPSLNESFGLPLLDGLAAGTPVVASDIPAFREVGADAVIYVDPRDPSSIAGALERVIVDDQLRLELKQRSAARLDLYRWSSAAEATACIYLDILRDHGDVGPRRVAPLAPDTQPVRADGHTGPPTP